MFFCSMDFNLILLSGGGHPAPLCTNFLWNLGFILIFFMVLQVFTGFILTFYMTLGMDCVFVKMFMMKEVGFGWFSFYFHMMTPSVVFFFMYLHMFKGFVYPLNHHLLLWVSGFILYLLFCIASFTGYCSVAGSMSYWALVVIKNIMSFILGDFLSLLFLGEEINNELFYSMFSYHYLVGILLLLFMTIHISILHSGGTTVGFCYGFVDQESFTSMLMMKDMMVLHFVLILFMGMLGFYPEYFFYFDNYVEIDSFSVPDEISPEWFLSIYFMMLKSLTSKLGGVVLMFLLMFVLFISPFVSGVLGNYLFSLNVPCLGVILVGVLSCSFLHVYGGQMWVLVFSVFLVIWLFLDMNLLVLVDCCFEEYYFVKTGVGSEESNSKMNNE